MSQFTLTGESPCMIVVRTLTSVPVDSSRASRIFVSVVSPMMIVLRKSCEGRRVKRRGGGRGHMFRGAKEMERTTGKEGSGGNIKGVSGMKGAMEAKGWRWTM